MLFFFFFSQFLFTDMFMKMYLQKLKTRHCTLCFLKYFSFTSFMLRVTTKAKARPIPIGRCCPAPSALQDVQRVWDGAGAVLLRPGQSGDASLAEPSVVPGSHGWAQGQPTGPELQWGFGRRVPITVL